MRTKPICSSTEVVTLQKHLTEVDEDGNNLIDFVELNEVLFA